MGDPLRERVLTELLILGALTLLFLVVFPERPNYVDALLALFAFSLIVVNARFTKNVIWARFVPLDDRRARRVRASLLVSAVTVPLALAFATIGAVFGYRESGWEGAWMRFSNWHLPLAFAFYLPWALLQQFLFQFYLLGRLRVLLPATLAVVTTGLIYSLVHLPDLWITVATAATGVFWTAVYSRYQILLPLGVSHALLATTFNYWVYGRDLFTVWTTAFP